jgi:hypothetical protein
MNQISNKRTLKRSFYQVFLKPTQLQKLIGENLTIHIDHPPHLLIHTLVLHPVQVFGNPVKQYVVHRLDLDSFQRIALVVPLNQLLENDHWVDLAFFVFDSHGRDIEV